ncbi:MarC family protein [Cetobacterium somerae]|uniref:MarC family protein n=1 Tax=Cetobacterium TaxID=180162 RepID=UPI001F05A7BE|nr:MarC family protein [Cetobacterium somerae]MCX3066915.1 MarC family protein [Cetobacterium somerae]UPO98376.1 MarC family protein [Cetobacterium somerae]
MGKEFVIDIMTYVLTIIGILNPFGNVPLFMTLTKDQNPEIRKKMYNAIVVSGFGIVTGFIVAGDFFMNYLYKIGMNELRVAGGMILVVVAFRNLLGLGVSKESSGSVMSEKDAIRYAITPLTFPMLVGPGTISTVMIIHKEAGLIISVGAVAVTFLIMKFLFSISDWLDKVLGEVVLFVLSRVMQIFIMSAGVKLISNGIKGIFLG